MSTTFYAGVSEPRDRTRTPEAKRCALELRASRQFKRLGMGA